MDSSDFQRARSPEAKQQREDAILAGARSLGAERGGIRLITLTDLADTVGMHKSAVLRYFETREQIFLRLSAEGWREWSAALRAKLERIGSPTAKTVASAFSTTLADRGMFCDLLAQAPLNLERNVSLEAVRAFKLVTHNEVDAIVEVMRRRLPGLTERDSIDVIATATSLSGAFWQMANPAPEVAALYRSDPRMAHAVFEIEPRVRRVLTAMLKGTLGD
jgi:AcrR family transcriptional regulator